MPATLTALSLRAMLMLGWMCVLSTPFALLDAQTAPPRASSRRATIAIGSDTLEVRVRTDRVDIVAKTDSGLIYLSTDSASGAQWADQAMLLPAPAAPVTSAPPEAPAALIMSSAAAGHRVRMGLARLGPDAEAPFELVATDGVLVRRLRLEGDQWGKLFGALWHEGLEVDREGDVDNGVAPRFEFQVEKPATPRRSVRFPRYPESLRAKGIEGRVLLQFVVDTNGRVEYRTVRELSSDHPDFTMAVREALLGLRFLPAEVEGRKVRQLVQQPFEFSLSRASWTFPENPADEMRIDVRCPDGTRVRRAEHCRIRPP